MDAMEGRVALMGLLTGLVSVVMTLGIVFWDLLELPEEAPPVSGTAAHD